VHASRLQFYADRELNVAIGLQERIQHDVWKFDVETFKDFRKQGKENQVLTQWITQTKVTVSMCIFTSICVTSISPHSQVILKFYWVCISKIESHTIVAQPMCTEAWITFKKSSFNLWFLPPTLTKATEEVKLMHRDATRIRDTELFLELWTRYSYVATLPVPIWHVGARVSFLDDFVIGGRVSSRTCESDTL